MGHQHVTDMDGSAAPVKTGRPPATFGHDSDHDAFGAEQAKRFAGWFDALVENIGLVIRGKSEVVRLVLQCLLARGHVLIEDNPGLAKTRLAKAIARSVDAEFSRIQFTPDLLPSDVIGVSIFHPERREFQFKQGPLFANFVLADEINRATPKTQSALLEAMAEHQITVDGTTYALPLPFLVIATQNPIEMQGTFPLLEAQMDRFAVRTGLGYPDRDDEILIMLDALRGSEPEQLEPVMTAEHMQDMIDAVRDVYVAPSLLEYIQNVVADTRKLPELKLGASPRAAVQLARLAQARAASCGRHYAIYDDVKALIRPTLCHRLMLRAEAAIQGTTAEGLLDRIVAAVPPPRDPPAR